MKRRPAIALAASAFVLLWLVLIGVFDGSGFAVGSYSQFTNVRDVAGEDLSVTYVERSVFVPNLAERQMWPPAAGLDVELYDDLNVTTEYAFFSEVLGANQEYMVCGTTGMILKSFSCIGWVYHGQQGKYVLTVVIDSEDFVHIDDAIEIVRAFAAIEK